MKAIDPKAANVAEAITGGLDVIGTTRLVPAKDFVVIVTLDDVVPSGYGPGQMFKISGFWNSAGQLIKKGHMMLWAIPQPGDATRKNFYPVAIEKDGPEGYKFRGVFFNSGRFQAWLPKVQRTQAEMASCWLKSIFESADEDFAASDNCLGPKLKW